MRLTAPLIALASFSVGTMLALSGCSPSIPPGYPKFHAAQRIVSLSPSTTELVGNEGNLQRLVGHMAADNYPPSVKTVGEVVGTVKPDPEKIARLDPDLVVYDASLYDDQEIAKLKSVAPHARFFALNGDTLDAYIQNVYDLGAEIGSEIHINDYVNRILAERGADLASPIKPTPRVAVLMPGHASPDYIAGVGTIQADAVRAVTGEPVGPSAAKFVTITPEALVALNPDVIVVPGTKTDTAGYQAVMANPRYQTIKAIRDKKVYVINEDILLRRGSRMEQFLQGLRAILTAKK